MTAIRQQMELAVMFAQCFNETEDTVQRKFLEEPTIDEVTVSSHKYRKHT